MITLTLEGGEQVSYDFVRTDQVEGDYDRQLYRPPFSKKVRQAGDGKLEPETIAVTVEVHGELVDEQVEEVIRNAEAATRASSVFWQGPLEGLVMSAVSGAPGGGYFVRLEWLTTFSIASESVLQWTSWGQEDITFADLTDVTFGELS